MTLLAGVLTTRPDVPLPESFCAMLRQVISRHPGESVEVYRHPRACLMKVDVGAYGEPACRISPSGTVAMLTGEPLLRRGAAATQGRSRDLETLHTGWDHDDWSLFEHTQGPFSAAYFRPDTATLTLATDKAGLRSVFYWRNENYFVFASALRILEAHPEIPKEIDLRSVTEIASFKWPLGGRTAYRDIALLRPGEILQVASAKLRVQQYWRWDSIPVSTKSETELLKEVYERFRVAVASRLRQDTTTVAMLSGGMDSRCIAATLRSLGARVHTFNFSLPGTQDRVFGRELAEKIGSIHYEVDMDISDSRTHTVLADSLRQVATGASQPIERPRLVWVGDAGSTTVGHLFLDEQSMALLRANRLDDAVENYLQVQKKNVVHRLLHPQVAAGVARVLHESLREELRPLRCQDPARNLYVYLMHNANRRHYTAYMDDIDLLRVEFQLPFFDSDFLASVMAVPMDLCLRHRFYTKLLRIFDPVVCSVPWQTYPGTPPCPLPIPAGLRYQWSVRDFPEWHASKKRELLEKTGDMLANDFPATILNKAFLRMARWAHRLGVRDYGYVLETALVYNRYLKSSGGRYVLGT